MGMTGCSGCLRRGTSCRGQNRPPWKALSQLSLKWVEMSWEKRRWRPRLEQVWRFGGEAHLTRKNWNHADLVSPVKFRLLPEGIGSFEGVLSREWCDQIAFQKACLEKTSEASLGESEGSLPRSAWWEKAASRRTSPLILVWLLFGLVWMTGSWISICLPVVNHVKILGAFFLELRCS